MAVQLYDDKYSFFSKNVKAYVKGYKQIINDDFIEIDISVKYYISIDMKSIGTITSNSKICVYCYDEEKKDILSNKVYFEKEIIDVINVGKHEIHSFARQYDFTKRTNDSWLGIYFDGNIDKLPDYITTNFLIENKSILNIFKVLDTLFDINMVTNKTKLRMHFSAETYIYPMGCFELKPHYKNYSFNIGDINNFGENDLSKFRFGSKYFKVGLRANYNQSKESSMTFKNFKIIRSI